MTAGSLSTLRVLIAPLLLFSLVTNAAILVSPLFMMQVLDRVVPSGNLFTLLLLLGIALGALALNSFVEFGRDLTLQRVGRWIDQSCTEPILKLPASQQAQMLEHLATVRRFFVAGTATSLLNLVWLPLFVVALALINLFYVLLVAGLLAMMLGVQFVRDSMTQTATEASGKLKAQERRWIKLLENLGIAITPQHVRQNIRARLIDTQSQHQSSEAQAEIQSMAGTGVLSFLRMSAQLLALSIGAYLVSQGSLSAGAMIAASLIAAKSVATMESSIAAIRQWPGMRASMAALNGLSVQAAPETEIAQLSGALKCDRVIYPRGSGAPPRLDRVSFELAPGSCLAIIGDAGSGKSTLLQAMVGLDPAPIGSVTFDQTDIRHMSAASRRRHIGFLPQMGGLCPGTIAENIAGFDEPIDDRALILAAKQARVHGLISALPDGYQTHIGQHPHLLTAGQKQQIALAAAFYTKPKYLFLDEPNALLDRNGERAMCEAIANLKEHGTTVVMVLHRAGVIGLADQILVLERGAVSDFGPRAQVLGRQSDGRRMARMPLRKTSLQDLSDWITGQFTRAGDAEFAAKAVMLGSEMFLAACLNGPQSTAREVEVQFQFIDDHNCELRLIEQGQTTADKLLRQVQNGMQNGETDFESLDEKAMPLFLASKLAQRFDIRNANNLAQYSARIFNEDGLPNEGRPN